MEEKKVSKRPGPVPVAGRVRTTIYLDESLSEWGKHQPGGLSELMRRLLEQERSRLAGAQLTSSPTDSASA